MAIPSTTSSMATEARIQIEKISIDIAESFGHSSEYGLYTGSVGKILFSVYNYALSETSIDSERIEDMLQLCQHQININPYNTLKWPIENGVAGYLWMIGHLQELELVEKTEDRNVNRLYELLQEVLEYQLMHKNFDLLQGAVGVSLVLYSQHKDVKYLEKVIEAFLPLVQLRDSNSSFVDYGKGFINMTIAHGMSSMIYLIGLYTKKSPIIRNDYLQVLGRMINFIANQKLELSHGFFTYPGYIREYNLPVETRQAWCNGAIGIGYTLLLVGKELEDSVCERVGVEILHSCISRTTPQQTGIVDAGFCHGTSGVAYLFRKAYFLTGTEDFLSISNFWFQKTLEYGQTNKSPSGYLFSTTKGLLPDRCLLSGSAGVGLSLLYLLDDTSYTWDNIMLLSM